MRMPKVIQNTLPLALIVGFALGAWSLLLFRRNRKVS